jgi:aminodeoxychorismate lyase
MTVFLNGQFLPEAAATVSVFDRAFLYGDGIFETLRVANGKPFRWAQHLERLEAGARFLGIRLPHTRAGFGGFADELIRRNKLPEALLRLTISRGVGVRGYSPKGAEKPTVVMTVHPVHAAAAAPGWRAHIASFRLPANEALARFKTCNKLAQVLGRAEAEAAGADEALLLNTDGFVVEGSSSNLFWVEGGTVCTPPLASGILPGVTREVVLELCKKRAQPFRETNLRPEELIRKEGAFLSLSSSGIVELAEVDGVRLRASPLVQPLIEAYAALVQAECA